jgi:hypothetical protein
VQVGTVFRETQDTTKVRELILYPEESWLAFGQQDHRSVAAAVHFPTGVVLRMNANGFGLAKLGGKTRNWNLQQVIQIGHIIAALTFLPEPFIADFSGKGTASF